MARILYDLAAADPAVRFSPYCWRTKMALKHKGLEWESIAWRFTDKEAIAFSGSTTVPVLVDHGRTVTDSWAIARYLDATYTHAPPLLGGTLGEAHARFIGLWCEQTIHAQIFRLITMDLYARLHENDKAYFRASREARFGRPLEEIEIDPAQGLPALNAALRPARAIIEKQPYLGGAYPSYADYILFGAFQWARAVSPRKLLDPSDPVYDWRARLLNTFDGYALKAPGEPA